jgi:hypothetical protein
MTNDNEYELAMSYIKGQLEVYGVACVKVQDGQVFAFRRDTVENLLAKMNDANHNEIIVFVKSGGDLRAN